MISLGTHLCPAYTCSECHIHYETTGKVLHMHCQRFVQIVLSGLRITAQLPTGVHNIFHVDYCTICYTSSNLHHAQCAVSTAVDKVPARAVFIGFQFFVEKLTQSCCTNTDMD